MFPAQRLTSDLGSQLQHIFKDNFYLLQVDLFLGKSSSVKITTYLPPFFTFNSRNGCGTTLKEPPWGHSPPPSRTRATASLSLKVLLFVCGCDVSIHGCAVCCLDGGGPSLLGKGSTNHQVNLPMARLQGKMKNREVWNPHTSSHIFNFFVIAW